MKKLICLFLMVAVLISVPVFADSISISTKGTYLTTGAVVYNYLNQNVRFYAQQQQELIGAIYITKDTPILRVVSDDKTLGLIQIEIKLSDNTLPILVWARILDIKK